MRESLKLLCGALGYFEYWRDGVIVVVTGIPRAELDFDIH